MEWQTQEFRSPTDVDCRLLNPPREICLDVLTTIIVEISVNNESVIRQSLILAWCPTPKRGDSLAYNPWFVGEEQDVDIRIDWMGDCLHLTIYQKR